MAGLWQKYLVLRRDGTVPPWPYLVLGARDPAVPIAIWTLAAKARELGMDPQYCRELHELAEKFDAYRLQHGDSDPDAPQHRTDDPGTVSRLSER